MSKKIAISLTAVALAASLLSGCGAAGTSVTTAASSTASGQSFNATVNKARQTAARVRIQYDDLREKSNLTANKDAQDKLEDQMVLVLSQGLESVRSIVAGNSNKDCRWAFNIADKALSQYQDLRKQWEATTDISKRRDITNKMEWAMVGALDQYSSTYGL